MKVQVDNKSKLYVAVMIIFWYIAIATFIALLGDRSSHMLESINCNDGHQCKIKFNTSSLVTVELNSTGIVHLNAGFNYKHAELVEYAIAKPNTYTIPTEGSQWSIRKTHVFCHDKDGCRTSPLAIETVKYNLTLAIKVIALYDNDMSMISVVDGDQIVLRFKQYVSTDSSMLVYAKLAMFVTALIFYLRFNKSLAGIKMIDKLPIQMFIKYLGFLVLLYNIPILTGDVRATNIVSFMITLFACMFQAYLTVFLMIILPSTATESSTIATIHNTTWKKIFLLVHLVVNLSMQVNFYLAMETDNGSTMPRLVVMQGVFTSMNIFAMLYMIIYFVKAVRHRLIVDRRYWPMLTAAIPFVLSYYASLNRPFHERSGMPSEVCMQLSASLFVVCLMHYFKKTSDSPVDGHSRMQQTSDHHNRIEIANTSSTITHDSLQSQETDRVSNKIDDGLDMPVKRLTDDSADIKHHDKHEEEVSYELEDIEHHDN